MMSFQKAVSILRDSLQEQLRGLIEQLPNIIVGVIMLLLTWLAAWIFVMAARRTLSHSSMRRSMKELILTFGKVLVWVVGILIAAMIIFPGLTPAKALGAAGLASVAIGLAFKDIFQNFFAGVLLLWRFPFEPDDFIEGDGVRGWVIETRLRMTTVRSPSGELVIVPNAHLIGNPLQVLTNRKYRRTIVQTGVAYKEDLARAIKVIEGVLPDCATINMSKPHDVFATGFGDSSMTIDVIYWTNSAPYEIRRSHSEVVVAIKAALDREGIEIPFPYRTLTFDEPLTIQREH
jgi:small conductance mechanosensitive channel